MTVVHFVATNTAQVCCCTTITNYLYIGSKLTCLDATCMQLKCITLVCIFWIKISIKSVSPCCLSNISCSYSSLARNVRRRRLPTMRRVGNCFSPGYSPEWRITAIVVWLVIYCRKRVRLFTCDSNMCDVSGICEVYLQVVCLTLLGPATLSSAVCLLSLLRVGQARIMTARALAISVRHTLDKFHHHSLATTAESG